jgi:hypothetical protein
MSISIYDENFELVELFDKSALFTNVRIDRDTVPEGVYVYDLRHGDSGNPMTVEPIVRVNHAGTVIMTEPLDFKVRKDEYLHINDGLNFLGKDKTFEEFMEEATLSNKSVSITVTAEQSNESQGMTMGGIG